MSLIRPLAYNATGMVVYKLVDRVFFDSEANSFPSPKGLIFAR